MSIGIITLEWYFLENSVHARSRPAIKRPVHQILSGTPAFAPAALSIAAGKLFFEILDDGPDISALLCRTAENSPGITRNRLQALAGTDHDSAIRREFCFFIGALLYILGSPVIAYSCNKVFLCPARYHIQFLIGQQMFLILHFMSLFS